MILVDSSAWIDYSRGRATSECNLLHRLLGSERLLTGDLILAQVLRGFRSGIDFRRALDICERGSSQFPQATQLLDNRY
jgi:hypothetical protein